MTSFLLTDQRELLIEAHRAEHDKRGADRIKTVLLLDEGRDYAEVAKILLLDDTTIRRYRKEYEDGGLDVLLKDEYAGRAGSLSSMQESELYLHLSEITYHRALDICEHIEKTYSIRYTPEGLIHLLHRLKLSYKKMKQVPGKTDPARQREFLTTYEDIKRGMGKNDELYFLDGSHPQHNSMAAYGWIPTGMEKELKTNSGRERINLNGALNQKDHTAIVLSEKTINADSMITLIQTLEKKHPRAKKIHCIADNAKYNHARKVADYVATSRVVIHFLPPYAPNLNLIERLWKFFHKKVLYNHYYSTYAEFKIASLDFFKDMSRFKDELDTLLTENFHIIGEPVLQT